MLMDVQNLVPPLQKPQKIKKGIQQLSQIPLLNKQKTFLRQTLIRKAIELYVLTVFFNFLDIV